MTARLTKDEQTKVRDWCSGWFDLPGERRCALPEWIMLKLSVDKRTAIRYAQWLTAEHIKAGR